MMIWDGKKLIEAREERLLNREEMRDAWFKKFRRRISEVSISNWERGIKPPGRNNILKLAALFEKPIEYFFTMKQPTRKAAPKKKTKKRFKLF